MTWKAMWKKNRTFTRRHIFRTEIESCVIRHNVRSLRQIQGTSWRHNTFDWRNSYRQQWQNLQTVDKARLIIKLHVEHKCYGYLQDGTLEVSASRQQGGNLQAIDKTKLIIKLHVEHKCYGYLQDGIMKVFCKR